MFTYNTKYLAKKIKVTPFIIAISLLFTFLSTSLMAATYYVDGKTSDDGGNGSILSPKKYITSGMKLMSAGDTLIIMDGTYTGNNNMIRYDIFLPPSGSEASGYTTIKAENPYGVIIDGEGIRQPVDLRNRDYFHFDGILFKNSSGTIFAVSGTSGDKRNHIKVTRCGFEETGSTYDSARSDSILFNYVSYGLIEDCFAFGTSRYAFYVLRSDHIILRRCVYRPDRMIADGYSNTAAFRFYDSVHSLMQNCIVIDGDTGLYYNRATRDAVPNAFWMDGVDGVSSDKIEGCLGVNNSGMTIYFQGDESVENNAIQNSVFWGFKNGIWTRDSNDIFNVEHCTIGNIKDPDSTNGHDRGIASDLSTMAVSANNIIYGCSWAGLRNIAGSGTDYNCLYANPRTDYEGCSASPHDICAENDNAVDPLTGTPGNGVPVLKYLPRIENGSNLKGAASDGGDIGATILYKIGRDGTLWGDPGYNEVTNQPLWPFPNEDKIKEFMRSYNLHGANGKRGFCADGNGLYGGPITLTSYIWEYLGHPCPPEICGGNGGNQPPVCNAGPDQNVTDYNGSGSEEVSLDGSGSSDPGGTIISYVWKENGSEIAQGETASVQLAVGIHDITLQVTDNDGATDTDTVRITVQSSNGSSLTISDVSALSPTDQNITIKWVTDLPATGKIEYGSDTSYGQESSTDSNLSTNHCIVLTGLSANTTYHYRVISQDGSGNGGTSEDYTFTTLPDQGNGSMCIWIEAEDGIVNPPMQVETDSSASNGKYITTPQGTENTTSPSAEASYSVDIRQEGDYYIWIRMYGPSGDNDALYIGPNGSFDRVYPSQWGQYEWIRVETEHNSGNYVHHLKAGINRISIGHGEELARADEILITNNPSFDPSTGNLLPPPDTLNAVAANSIDVSWSSVSGAVGYNVYRSTTSGSGYVKINGSTPVTGTSYVDQNTTPGTTYYYVVTSVNSAGQESNYSSEASATEPIGNGAPSIGSFTADPNPADNPKRNISFVVQASDPDGDALSYTIDFGDGSAAASASTAEHAYSSDGTYNAKATVADGNGHTVEKTIQVTVNDSDPAKVSGVHAQ